MLLFPLVMIVALVITLAILCHHRDRGKGNYAECKVQSWIDSCYAHCFARKKRRGKKRTSKYTCTTTRDGKMRSCNMIHANKGTMSCAPVATASLCGSSFREQIEFWRPLARRRVLDTIVLMEDYMRVQPIIVIFTRMFIEQVIEYVRESLIQVERLYNRYDNREQILAYIYPQMYVIANEFICMVEQNKCQFLCPISTSPEALSMTPDTLQRECVRRQDILAEEFHYMLNRLANTIGSVAVEDNTRRDAVNYYIMEYGKELTRFTALDPECYDDFYGYILSYYTLSRIFPAYNWEVDFDDLSAALGRIRALPSDASEDELIDAAYPWTSDFGAPLVEALIEFDYVPVGTVEALPVPEEVC